MATPENHKTVNSTDWIEALATQPPVRGRRADPTAPTAAVRQPSILAPPTAIGQQSVQIIAQPDQNRVSLAFTGIHIPSSIELPRPGTETVASEAIRPAPSLLSELEPIILSEDSSEQSLLHRVEPTYPERALRAGLQGVVVLQASIGKTGVVEELKLVSGSLLLGQAAYHAVKQWRYKPCIRNGKAVEAMTYVTVDFTLPQRSQLAPYTH
jgi:TonB family protein